MCRLRRTPLSRAHERLEDTEQAQAGADVSPEVMERRERLPRPPSSAAPRPVSTPLHPLFAPPTLLTALSAGHAANTTGRTRLMLLVRGIPLVPCARLACLICLVRLLHRIGRGAHVVVVLLRVLLGALLLERLGGWLLDVMLVRRLVRHDLSPINPLYPPFRRVERFAQARDLAGDPTVADLRRSRGGWHASGSSQL
jgi:hypothetical protein